MAHALALYGPAMKGLRWVPVAGGFSGALVWRGEDTSPAFVLKAYPPDTPPGHVSQVHAWMQQAAHLPFVPAIIPTHKLNATAVVSGGRVWELVRWMPGEPALLCAPTPARLANAVAALAQLHRAWKPPVPHLAPCPGVLRRLDVLRAWQPAGPNDALLNRAREVVSRLAPHAIRALLPWAGRPLPVQPCLCDVHADHVLFDGVRVTGVIDFGAMKLDHIAVDLARLLGSAEAGDEDFSRAVSEYQAHGEIHAEVEFVYLLDRTGTLCAVATWCRRHAEVLASPRLSARLARLVWRAEAITPVHLKVSS